MLILLFIVVNSHLHAQGTWKKLSSQPSSYNYGVMLLLTDGSVMCKNSSGGPDASGSGWDKLIPDATGSYINGTWTPLTPMNYSRLYFSTQVLRSGKVYVAGGEYGTGKATCETYDPLSDSWTPGPKVPTGDTIYDANSETLPDGRVLQSIVYGAGSFGTKNLIYDPAANTYAFGPSNASGSSDESTWLKLKDNSILFVDDFSKNSERYIPSLGAFVADAVLPLSIYDTVIGETGPAVLLPDGRGFFIGSNGNTVFYTPSGTTAPGTWTAGPKLPRKLGAPDGCAAMMTNGKVLISASDTPSVAHNFPSPTWFFVLDYPTDTFIQIKAPIGLDTLSIPCFDTHMLALPDGSILFSDAGPNYYEYVPNGTPLAAGKPSVAGIFKVNCDTYMATGTGFNGITEGATYGDDWQMASNYPIVRVTAGTNVYYARTFNWNSNGLMRGSAPDTTMFSLPAGLPEGTYTLEVVANGNPSATVSFSTCTYTGVAAVRGITSSLTVYPNPADKQANVVFQSKRGGQYSIKLVNILGQVVREETAEAFAGENKHTLQLDGIPKGVYTITIHDGSSAGNARLVIE